MAILGVTLPSTLKQLTRLARTRRRRAGPTSTVVTPAAGTLAPPTLAGSGTPTPAATAVVAGALVSTDAPAAPSTAKLVSFSLFVSKDPFQQQVSAGTPAGRRLGHDRDDRRPRRRPRPPRRRHHAADPDRSRRAAPPTSAVICVNGTSETVAVGKTFPAAAPQPFFQLVSLTPTSAKIGIAGGSLTSGQNTVTIPVGKTVTLMNTADGTKYTIKLVSVA